MSRDLTNKVIIITGASSGIGRATANLCAAAGMDVVLNARREDRLHEVAKEIESHGRRAAIVAGDVTDNGITHRMLDTAQHEFGRFDVVFANAGYGSEQAMHEMTDEDLRAMFEVNFFAANDLLREAAKRLIEQNRPGHLLMCSSCLAKFTIPGHGCYSATKAAQNHVCRAMRLELLEHDIEVSSVLPVTTTTEFFTVAAAKSGKEPVIEVVPDHTPKMFLQSPEHVARAVVKCLRKPKAEVWTSRPMRWISGIMNAFPGLTDLLMKHYLARKLARRSTEANP